jgi:hypothetical protein
VVGTEVPQGLRIAEVLASLSLVTDLARGHPSEEAMRACLLATAVGRCLRLSEAELADTYYATLLRFVGCTATSTLLATGFAGDDVEVRRLGDLTDVSVPREALGFLWTIYRCAGVDDKVGVSTRAGVTLFALEHQLLREKINRTVDRRPQTSGVRS